MSIKAGRAWRAWLAEFAEHEGQPRTAVIDAALAHHAALRRFKAPPDREA